MNLLGDLISDGELPSAMRVAFLLVVLSFTLTWTIISIRANAFAPVDWKEAGILIAAFAAKAHQARSESLTPRIVAGEPPTTTGATPVPPAK